MNRFLELRVRDYMTTPVVGVAPGTALAALEEEFRRRDFNGLPVLDGEILLGMVTKFDVLKAFVFTPRAILPHYDEIAQLTAEQIMTRDVITFRPEASLTRVLQTLVDFRVKSLPVVDGKRVVGIVAREDIVRALRDASTSTALDGLPVARARL